VRAKELERENKVAKNDMLTSFLDRGLTAHQALPELAVVIAAGTDNLASATQAVIFNVITKPAVYQRLQAEIDAAVTHGEAGLPISESAARSLPYLQACIAEGIRYMPPDTQLRERMVPPEGDTLCGHFLPGVCQMCAWDVSR
jgi:cytochrome P450